MEFKKIDFEKENDFPIKELLRLAVGNPTEEKLQKVLDSYKEASSCSLYGLQKEGKWIGLIGIQEEGEILHLAVLSSEQRKGWGRWMVEEMVRQRRGLQLFAKTDAEAKGFYEKLHFRCTAYQGAYGIRYLCKKDCI